MSGIKAGDLVMVVKASPCCGDTRTVGKVFVAQAVLRGRSTCEVCGHPRGWVMLVQREDGYSLLSRLIRIDPPALPESIDTEREVTA